MDQRYGDSEAMVLDLHFEKIEGEKSLYGALQIVSLGRVAECAFTFLVLAG